MKEIPLTKDKVALVDDADYDLLLRWKWHAVDGGNTWYAQAYAGGGRKAMYNFLMHRVIMNAPPHLEVDHRNGDGLDNRRENLRLATSSQNSLNRRKYSGSSRFMGVYWNRERRKWHARVRVPKQGNVGGHVGYFDSEEEAARARDRRALELHGEFALLNFPLSGSTIIDPAACLDCDCPRCTGFVPTEPPTEADVQAVLEYLDRRDEGRAS